MNPRIKAEWLDALRSGEYKQANGALHEIDPATGAASFCCLGVLCDLHRKETKWGEWIKDGREESQFTYLGGESVLPVRRQ